MEIVELLIKLKEKFNCEFFSKDSAKDILGEDCESYLGIYVSTGMLSENDGCYMITEDGFAATKYPEN